MAASSPHTGFGSAALVRLLAQWGLTVPPGTAAPGVERLGQWLSWTDAVAVARVLSADAAACAEGPPLAPAAQARALEINAGGVGKESPGSSPATSADGPAAGIAPAAPATPPLQHQAGARPPTRADQPGMALPLEVQAHLQTLRAIALALGRPSTSGARARNPADRRTFTHAAAAADDPLDLALHQRRYRSAQRELADAVGSLRPRLREALSDLGGAWARLAALDAALDEALSPRERQALTLVASALARRFDNHRRGAEAGAAMRAASLADAAAAGASMHRSGQSAPVDGFVDRPVERPPAPATGSASGRRARLAAEPEWLQAFRTDQQRALLAELELRWAPVAGLVAALQAAHQAALCAAPRPAPRGHPLDRPLGPDLGRCPEPQADRQPAPATGLFPPASA